MFKVGEKVVCVGGSESARSNYSFNENIYISQVYEISVGSFFYPLTGDYHIELVGMKTWWCEKYFRKLSEVSTELTEEILENLETEIDITIEEPELV